MQTVSGFASLLSIYFLDINDFHLCNFHPVLQKKSYYWLKWLKVKVKNVIDGLHVMSCHGSHVGGQEQELRFFFSGSQLPFYVNYVSKFSFVLSINIHSNGSHL